MILAALELVDYLVLGILFSVFSGGTILTSRSSIGHAADRERLRRIEDKLNVLLVHNGLDYVARTKESWQRSADENRKLNAVQEYRSAHAVSQEEATRVVEDYIEDNQTSER